MAARPFLGGYLIGLVVVPLAVALAVATGPGGGWAVFAALALGAMALGPFSRQRIAGIVAGGVTAAAVLGSV